MTEHYFENKLVRMHYYQFGHGAKKMLCFHGYGMHGKQFTVLEPALGNQYTFYGFDLFFHKETKLKDSSLNAVKKGISKEELSQLFLEFCEAQNIVQFSIIAYSMGSHYATTLVEEMPHRIRELIVAAPACFNPGKVVSFLSLHPMGGILLKYLALHTGRGMPRFLWLLRRLSVIDKKAYNILLREVGTYELRFAFFACIRYKRFLTLNAEKFVERLNTHPINSYFIFGKRDKNYPVKIGRSIVPRILTAQEMEIDANHDMIHLEFGQFLVELLHDH
ncbi:alpha/beta fold hydrolase [Albibacterium bauzanense]|uniref:Pimeloyl-ACP methyl ester carboxylesterase n=1 Tax=Albibacterium bauzanense TaxID=653929 RepID=A0A4V2PX45_9SPHI|nr:alpha/beta hydrolase [Albibacterium bauzanense]TCK80621.1 pimeloyl-ACP methyl ester carboxylesterase [Albibacterium bauzanense]